MTKMTEEEFDKLYPLLTNHIDPNARWAFDEGAGCLFETYGEELAFVRAQNPLHIWTLVDGEDDNQYVISGYHLVNRIGYLISTCPFPEDANIEVLIPHEAIE